VDSPAAAETREDAHRSTADAVRAEHRAAMAADRAAPSDADTSPEVVKRMAELRTEGHGPQRHVDITRMEMHGRLGTPTFNPNGTVRLDANGFVESTRKLDPMTGTTTDGVTGRQHRCEPIVTRFDSPAEFVQAEAYLRQRTNETGAFDARVPISEIFGADPPKLTGYYLDPADPSHYREVDFTGGTVFAAYSLDANGDRKLDTLFCEPAPFDPRGR
jgi:hypothetical protein